MLQSKYGYFIAIPYRSHINHPYAFKFKNSIRSQKNKSGLDYTKAVIITNPGFISTKDAIIDKDEYNETYENIEYIVNDISKYIDDYIHYICNEFDSKKEKQLVRKYRYSTLRYFHNELGIK